MRSYSTAIRVVILKLKKEFLFAAKSAFIVVNR